MKKIPIVLLTVVALCFQLTACGKPKTAAESTASTPSPTATAEPVIEEEAINTEILQEDTMAESTEKNTLTLTVGERSIQIELYDTPAANALREMLPLELTFSDFNETEKISYLPQNLPTDGEPDGCDPDVGDFCLYAPWGNLSVFYRDFPYSESLILLGHISDDDTAYLASLQGEFSAELAGS